MVGIQVICAACGRRTKEVIFDGSAPRGEIEDLRATKGWTRTRPRNTESMRDLCPDCSEEDRGRKSTRNSTARPKGGA